MKIGSITTANSKGQIVIPKSMRESLGIKKGDKLGMKISAGGVFIYPVEAFVAKIENEDSYLELLKQTKGTWVGENLDEAKKKKSDIELKASKSRKNAW